MEASLGCTPGTFLLKPSSFPLLIAQVRSRKPKGRTLVSPCWYGEVTAPGRCPISHTWFHLDSEVRVPLRRAHTYK